MAFVFSNAVIYWKKIAFSAYAYARFAWQDTACLALPQAPDGHIFYSYAKAQEHWEVLGDTPIQQTFTDASKSSRRVARLPEGWEVKAIHRDIGQVYPALLSNLSHSIIFAIQSLLHMS